MKDKKLHRIFKFYRLAKVTNFFVHLRWLQKHVPDPENRWHLKHGRWKVRQKKVSRRDFDKYYRDTPPIIP